MARESNGHAVDRSGSPVDDPSDNTFQLTEAAVRRLDDLRGMAVQRMDDLRAADEKLADSRFSHIEFVAKLRAEHEKDNRQQNNERIAALRLVDIATRNEDRKTADDAIRQLAAQTESLRQTLSKQVTDTAETLSKAKLESDRATEVRITALEKTSYTGAGEKSVSDPATARLAEAVEGMIKAAQIGGGERRGKSEAFGSIKAGILLVIAILGFLIANVIGPVFRANQPTPVTVTQPAGDPVPVRPAP